MYLNKNHAHIMITYMSIFSCPDDIWRVITSRLACEGMWPSPVRPRTGIGWNESKWIMFHRENMENPWFLRYVFSPKFSETLRKEFSFSCETMVVRLLVPSLWCNDDLKFRRIALQPPGGDSWKGALWVVHLKCFHNCWWMLMISGNLRRSSC